MIDHDRSLVDNLKAATVKEPMLQFFAFEHLPAHLRLTSALIAELAVRMVDDLPRNPERTVGLRKLLEAKDCFVRAVIYKEGGQ